MCKYCEEDKRKKRECIINTPIVSLRIIKNNGLNALEVKSYNREKQIVDNYKIIKYCPMCRKEVRRVRAKYIKTMDFLFEKVNILNCKSSSELAEKIKENEVIKIDNYGSIEYINSSYIMFYVLEEEESYDK